MQGKGKGSRRKSKQEHVETESNVPQGAKRQSGSFKQEELFEDFGAQLPVDEYMQLEVINQDEVLGGSASCGYHALKNGLIIARLLSIEEVRKKDIQALLTSRAPVEQLFGNKTNIWRAHVIEERAKQLAAWYIRDVLLKSIKGARVAEQGVYDLNLEQAKVSFEPFAAGSQDNEAERLALQGILSTISHHIAASAGTRQGNFLTYDISLEQVARICREYFIKNIKEDNNKAAYQVLQDVSKIISYFPHFAQLSFWLQDDNTIMSPHQETIHRHTYAGGKGKVKGGGIGGFGQWLEVEEIKALYALEKGRNGELVQDIFDNVRLPFKEIFYIEDPFENPLQVQFETHEGLQFLAQDMQSPFSSFLAVLIIHQSGFPHWFTCVIKKQRNKTSYIFADSSNMPRTKDLHARNVIRVLNGEAPLEQARPQAERAEPKKAESSSSNTSSAKPEATAQPSQEKTKQEGAKPSQGSMPKPEDFFKAFTSQGTDNETFNYGVGIPTITIEDIIGVPQEVIRTVNALTNPRPHNRRFSMLLYGPPGTGKTTLVKAIAGSTKRQLFMVYASNMVTKFQGSGAQAVKDMFTQAEKAQKPAIVFIDEIDLVTGKADAGDANARSYEEARIALQAELDKKNPNIFFIAATNHLDNIDPTIRDRLDDYTVKIDLPTRDLRKQIFALYARKNEINIEETLLNRLADATEGLSGRQIEKIVLKAIDLADARDQKKLVVTEQDLYSALYFHDERIPQQPQREIMLRHFAVDRTNIDDAAYRRLAVETAGITGRQIEEMVKKALNLAKDGDKQEQITADHFFIAIHSMNPKILPDMALREILIRHYLLQKNRTVRATFLTYLARKTEGFNASQLEKAIARAFKIGQKLGRQELLHGDLMIALHNKQTKFKIDEPEHLWAVLDYYLTGKQHNIAIRTAATEILALGIRMEKSFFKKSVIDAYNMVIKAGRTILEIEDLKGIQVSNLINQDLNLLSLNICRNTEMIRLLLAGCSLGKNVNLPQNFFKKLAENIRGKKVLLGQKVVTTSSAVVKSRSDSFVETTDYTFGSTGEIVGCIYEEYIYELFVKDIVCLVKQAENLAIKRNEVITPEDFYSALNSFKISFDKPDLSTISTFTALKMGLGLWGSLFSK